MKDFVSVVIVAGGKGTRTNMDVPKQFYEVLGKPLLYYTIKYFFLINKFKLLLFSRHKRIDFSSLLYCYFLDFFASFSACFSLIAACVSVKLATHFI